MSHIKREIKMTAEEQAQKIIDISGNNLHYKVAEYFRSAGWEVMLSPYYIDGYTEKPREIDILAEKDFMVTNLYFGRNIGFVKVKLFIECKYIASPTVFWFDKKDMNRAIEKVINSTPLEDPSQNSTINRHRYLSDVKVAKIFDSGNSKANENEVFFKASTQCLNALIGNFRQPNIIPESPNLTSFAVINYPIIVCNKYDQLFKSEKSTPVQISDMFQLEMNYAFSDYSDKKRREYFLIDVVDFNQIPDLLKEIEEKDIAAIAEKSQWDADAVNDDQPSILDFGV